MGAARAEASGVTEAQLEELDKQNEAQNQKVNQCLGSCIKMLEETLLKMAKSQHQLATTDMTKAKEALRVVTLEQMQQAEKQLSENRELVTTLMIKKGDVQYLDEKVATLQRVGNEITEAKDLNATALSLSTKKKSASDSHERDSSKGH